MEHCKKLNISNIRTLQRINRMWKNIEPLLKGREEVIVSQAISSLVLFTWARYESNESGPNLSFIRNYSQIAELLDKKRTSLEKSWGQMLREYGYTMTDNFDKELINFVERGYLNKEQINVITDTLNRDALNARKRHLHQEAWGLFLNSFDENPQIPRNIATSFLENIDALSLADLQRVVSILRPLHEDQIANDLTDRFFTAHPDAAVNPDYYGESHKELDSYIRARLERYKSNAAIQKELGATIKKIASTNGWTVEDEEFLASCTVDQYCSFLKTEVSAALIGCVRRFLEFEHGSSNGKEIASKARQALLRVAAEGPLNKLRISALYKIEIDEPQNNV